LKINTTFINSLTHNINVYIIDQIKYIILFIFMIKKAIKIKIFYIKSASFNNQTHIFLIIISYFKKKNGMLYLFMITKVLKYDLNFSDGHKI